MDFERAIIRSLFYDFQISRIVHYIECDLNNQFPKSAFEKVIEDLPVLIKNQMKNMTLGETRLISKMLKQQWNNGVYASKNKAAHPLVYLSEISKRLLETDTTTDIPLIKYNQLLRWRELSLLIGEELPVCAYLAASDTRDRGNFFWPDILNHNNVTINKLLKEHNKCDIHSHMDASSNAYEIGWIFNMNHAPNNTKKTNENEWQVDAWLAIAMTIRYWLFLLITQNKYPSEFSQRQLISAFSSKDKAYFLQKKTIEDLKEHRLQSVQTNDQNIKYWDYAATNNELSINEKSKPEILFVGERKLLYTYLRKLFPSKDKELIISKFSGYFYLYCILKVNFRKLLIQTNGHIGLANYQQYQSHLHTIDNSIKTLRWRYAILTSKGLSGNDCFEARIPFENEEKLIDTAKINTTKPLSGDCQDIIYKSDNADRVSLVISITKPHANSLNNLRKNIAQTINDIDVIMGKYYGYKMGGLPLVGFDIAGSDTNCRPKQVKPIIDELRKRKCHNITYHAGEDFYDLIDGLRSINEILYDLNWEKPNRLAHLSALYTDAKIYYKNRNGNMAMPAKVLYDNLTWFLSETTRLGKSLDIESEQELKDKINELKTLYKCIDQDDPVEAEFQRSNEIVIWHFHPSEKFIDTIVFIQKLLGYKIKKREIHIESCPTSNYHIGYFEQYNETPFCQMAKDYVKHHNLNASINTDARAIFATSLDNEYALTAIALEKSKMPNRDIHNILSIVASNSSSNRFRVERKI